VCLEGQFYGCCGHGLSFVAVDGKTVHVASTAAAQTYRTDEYKKGVFSLSSG
jgi:hypothetical protein